MPQALPVIGGILGLVNAVQGIQSQQAQQRALSQASGLTEEQANELRTLRAILSDPEHPVRAILRGQAETGIARGVSNAQQDVIARLAASGWRSPQTLAGPVAAIAARGVAAQGDLERSLVNDFLQKRLSLVGSPDIALRGGLSIADLAGRSAGASGEALGGLLDLLQRLRRTTSGASTVFIPSYAGIGPGGYETYRTGKFYQQ